MSIRYKIRSTFIALSAFLTVMIPAVGFADGKQISILHHVIGAGDLPEPEVPMTIKFALDNTRDLKHRVRALIVKDGRLYEPQLKNYYLSEHDRPTYEFEIMAPLADMQYQFFAYDKQGVGVASDLYSVRRQCLPPYQLIDLKLDPNLKPVERIRGLYQESVVLDDEIKQYRQVESTLKRIQGLLEE